MIVNNEEIAIQVIKNNGKVRQSIKLKNRLTNNFLDFMMYKTLPRDKNTGFPRIYPFTDIYLFPFLYCYVKLEDEIILNDTSTTMTYDIKTREDLYLGNDNNYYESYKSIHNSNGSTENRKYSKNITSTDNGKKITMLGFGADDTSETSYLMSFLDVSDFNIYLYTGDRLVISRIDNFKHSYEYVQNDATFDFPIHLLTEHYLHTDNLYYTAVIKGIKFIRENGSYKYLPIEDANLISNYEIGSVQIDANFTYPRFQPNGGLFPSNDLYPSNNLYPQYVEYGFTKLGIVFDERSYYSGDDVSTGKTYEIIKNLNTAPSSILNYGSLYTILKFERGE